jgi:hypothetical protein
MRLRWLALALAVTFGPAAIGQTAASLQQQALRVEATLNRLSQEQAAVYQQFQMIQEMRRGEERMALQRMPIYRMSPNAVAPSYDDLQRDDDARTQRMNDLQAEGDRLYARYRELEEQKRPLLDTLFALSQTQPETYEDLQAGTTSLPLPTPVPAVTQPSPGFTGSFPGFQGGAPGFTPQTVPPPLPANPTR